MVSGTQGMIPAMMMFVFVDHVSSPHDPTSTPQILYHKIDWQGKACLLRGPLLDKARPYADVALLVPLLVPGAKVGIRWLDGSCIVTHANSGNVALR